MKKIFILKFGGTSMGTTQSITQCRSIIQTKQKEGQIVVIPSALSGVTDELIDILAMARQKKPKIVAGRINTLEDRHRDIAKNFISNKDFDEVWEQDFNPVFKELRSLMNGISLVGDYTNRSYAVACSFGERLSTRILHWALQQESLPAILLTEKNLIRTHGDLLEGTADFRKTKMIFQKKVLPLLKKGQIPIIPGFIGHNTQKETTLLGRGGSDYSACIAGVSLKSNAIEIWTDVDGIMSADPAKVPDAKAWRTIGLETMSEIAFSGAKVLHPKTITAAVKHGIPVWIRNTFNPEAPGTIIGQEVKPGLRGIVEDTNQILLHLVEPEMLKGVGFIQNCSEIFVRHNVSIDVCATSEVTFTCTIPEDQFNKKLVQELETIAEKEIMHTQVAKICIIGHQIAHDMQVLHQITSALSKEKIHTVSVGASGENITLIVDRKRADEVLKILHKKLFG